MKAEVRGCPNSLRGATQAGFAIENPEGSSGATETKGISFGAEVIPVENRVREGSIRIKARRVICMAVAFLAFVCKILTAEHIRD